MDKSSCTRCGKAVMETGAAFCPFCGAPLEKAAADETPAGAEALLNKAARQRSNKKKLALLRQAREQYPDCLAVEEEWLFQGKLPEKPDPGLGYRCIECYLLHLYLTPEDFTPEEAAAMRQELFADPQLERCRALADSPEAFTARYLERLSREFIDVFHKGSNQYMPRLLGLRLEQDPARMLAKPGAQVLRAIGADDQLTPQQKAALTTAFEAAFEAECGDLRHLRQAMKN